MAIYPDCAVCIAIAHVVSTIESPDEAKISQLDNRKFWWFKLPMG